MKYISRVMVVILALALGIFGTSPSCIPSYRKNALRCNNGQLDHISLHYLNSPFDTIDFGANRIKSLNVPNCFNSPYTEYVRVLLLHDNQISDLTDNNLCDCFINLDMLYLVNNSIKTVPDLKCKKLTHLVLDHNPVKSVSEEVQKIPNLSPPILRNKNFTETTGEAASLEKDIINKIDVKCKGNLITVSLVIFLFSMFSIWIV
ncbi:hypothetical protein ILUMI_02100 [Ignelater luminosus]|uniref:Uncharacterized protein n=1 Tax=Ignelater luminosus TaxID=2038154 RepID=A0A8K0DIY7_IGNLU|nr:hypothetical protein ILUMI_02100 [Ignelater luminosus]